MEQDNSRGEQFPASLPIRAARYMLHIVRNARAEVKDSWQVLKATDLNPHEGKLRASVAPTEVLIPEGIPDYPPMHDDTIE